MSKEDAPDQALVYSLLALSIAQTSVDLLVAKGLVTREDARLLYESVASVLASAPRDPVELNAAKSAAEGARSAAMLYATTQGSAPSKPN